MISFSQMTHVLDFIKSGGFVMIPLLICSLLTWIVIFERGLKLRKLTRELGEFHPRAAKLLLKGDLKQLSSLCGLNRSLPTARLMESALDRFESKEPLLQNYWRESVERQRQLENQSLRKNLWILGTIANAAPFMGLFGTVVGILQSFGDIQKTGRGGFDVVAGGISESLIATAAGIVVGIIAVVAFNSFQAKVSEMVLILRLHVQDLCELLGEALAPGKR